MLVMLIKREQKEQKKCLLIVCVAYAELKKCCVSEDWLREE